MLHGGGADSQLDPQRPCGGLMDCKFPSLFQQELKENTRFERRQGAALRQLDGCVTQMNCARWALSRRLAGETDPDF